MRPSASQRRALYSAAPLGVALAGPEAGVFVGGSVDGGATTTGLATGDAGNAPAGGGGADGELCGMPSLPGGCEPCGVTGGGSQPRPR